MRFWVIRIAPWRVWRWMLSSHFGGRDKRVGLFKNLPAVVPGRWGFFVLGFEFGSRQPGDPFGRWLKLHGLWPW